MTSRSGQSDNFPMAKPMPLPPDSRIIPLERQTPLTHQQIEQVRFGLGDTGPLAQAVMNSNVAALTKQIFNVGVTMASDRMPNDPVVGQMVYEKDTQRVLFWSGTAWVTPANATPTGALQAFAGSTAPTGWVLCDGTLYTVALYPALYAVLGVAYGGVLGTSFNVPNMAGRIPVGAGTGAQQGTASSGVITGGTALAARSVGQFFGDERTELHTHVQNSHNHTQDAHNHNMNPSAAAGYDSGTTGNVMAAGGSYWVARSTANVNDARTTVPAAATATNQATTATNQNTFAGTGANTQPSVVTNYIIKT